MDNLSLNNFSISPSKKSDYINSADVPETIDSYHNYFCIYDMINSDENYYYFFPTNNEDGTINLIDSNYYEGESSAPTSAIGKFYNYSYDDWEIDNYNEIINFADSIEYIYDYKLNYGKKTAKIHLREGLIKERYNFIVLKFKLLNEITKKKPSYQQEEYIISSDKQYEVIKETVFHFFIATLHNYKIGSKLDNIELLFLNTEFYNSAAVRNTYGQELFNYYYIDADCGYLYFEIPILKISENDFDGKYGTVPRLQNPSSQKAYLAAIDLYENHNPKFYNNYGYGNLFNEPGLALEVFLKHLEAGYYNSTHYNPHNTTDSKEYTNIADVYDNAYLEFSSSNYASLKYVYNLIINHTKPNVLIPSDTYKNTSGTNYYNKEEMGKGTYYYHNKSYGSINLTYPQIETIFPLTDIGDWDQLVIIDLLRIIYFHNMHCLEFGVPIHKEYNEYLAFFLINKIDYLNLQYDMFKYLIILSLIGGTFSGNIDGGTFSGNISREHYESFRMYPDCADKELSGEISGDWPKDAQFY